MTGFTFIHVQFFTFFFIARVLRDVKALIRTDINHGKVSRDIFDITVSHFVNTGSFHHERVGPDTVAIVLGSLDQVFFWQTCEAWREFARCALTDVAVTEGAAFIDFLAIGQIDSVCTEGCSGNQQGSEQFFHV